MVEYCLDTSIIIEIFRGNRELSEKIDNLKLLGNLFYLTPITLCELFKGAFLHVNSNTKIDQINKFISYFEILSFDIDSCKEYGYLYYKNRNLGKMIPDFDLMIASITKSKEVVFVTKDKKHFNNLGIKLEEW